MSGGAQVSLNIVSEGALRELLAAEPSTNLWIEVPAFMAGDPAHSEALRHLHAQGNTLLIKGRPLQELPREVLPCFKYSIIDLSEERRGDAPPAPGVSRTISHVQSGVRTLADGSFPHTLRSIRQRYDELSEPQLLGAARTYGATYLLTTRPFPSGTPSA